MRALWRLDGLFPVVFLLLYSLCVTIMILHLTSGEQKGSDSQPLITLRQVRVPGPYDKCILTNMTAEQVHEQQQRFRLKQIYNQCSLCTAKNITKPETAFSLCQEASSSKRIQAFKNILVDDQSKLLFCMVPKVASTNWKRALLKLRSGNQRVNLTKDLNIHSRHDLRQAGFTFLDLYPFEERQYRLKNYYKFMFVRNPLARLVSAYKDKFTKNMTWSIFFQRKYGRAIIDRFRPNTTEDIRMNGKNVTFEEFVKYIIESNKSGRFLNVHWTPMHQLCQPCDLQYDFIGKFESLSVDAMRAMGKVFGPGRACTVGFPAENVNPPERMSAVMQYYRGLEDNVFADLYNMFQTDFDLFGYDIQRVARTGRIVI